MVKLSPSDVFRGNPISSTHEPDPADVVELLERLEAQSLFGMSPAAWGVSTANAAEQNDLAFTDYEAEVSGRTVDLAGGTYLVTAKPTGNDYVNGSFKVADAFGNIAVSYPQRGTLLKSTLALTHGLCNSTWPQGNRAVWAGEFFVAFSENNAHGVADGSARVVVMRCRDGSNWIREDIALGFPCTVWGMTVYGGFQMLHVRDESGGANQGKFYLYGRQLAQRVELDYLEAVDGDNRYQFNHTALPFPLMMYEAAVVQFNGLPADLGGQNLNTEDAVAYRSQNTVEFRAPSNFSGNWTHSGTFEMNVRESDWFHITFDGAQTLGEALEAAGGGSGEPTLAHCISMFKPGVGVGTGGADYASRGDYYTGVSGGQFNAAVAKIINAVDENNKGSVERLQEISGAAAAHNEVSVVCLSDGRLCGFVRTNDLNDGQTTPLGFWTNTDDLVTAPVLSLFPTGGFEESPVDICVMGDKLVGFGSIERRGDGKRGIRTMVLLIADIEDAFTNGASAFEIIDAEKGRYSDQTLTGGAVGVGLASVVAIDDQTVLGFWNQEIQTNDPYRLDTVTQIMATKFGLGSANPFDYHGPSQIAWGSVPERSWRVKLRGTPAHGDDSIIQWENIDEQSAPIGYSAGVVTLPVTGRYRVTVQMSYEANTGTNYIQLRKGGDVGPFGDTEEFLALAYNNNAANPHQSAGFSSVLVDAKAGDTMAFKVNATAGITDSSVRNYAIVELLP